MFKKPIILGLLLLAMTACAADTGEKHPVAKKADPTYSANGSYDDNGAEPAPNNGNQNFGRRW